MDRFKIQITLLLLLIGLAACVKDPQDIPSGGMVSDPAFRMEGKFDGNNVIIEAGNNQWTVVPATTAIDSSIIYSSTFSLNGCVPACSPSWTFNLYQVIPATANANETFLNTVQTGEVDHIPSEAERVYYQVEVQTHPDLFYLGYSYWEDLNNPADTFGSVFQTELTYGKDLELCFHSFTSLGCQYNQCISYDPRTGVPCTGYIQTQLESSRHLSMTVRMEGTPPFQIEWMNGETTPSIVVQIQDSLTTAFADVTVTDANGNSIEIAQTVIVQNGYIDACYFPINITSTPVSIASPQLLAGGFEMIYIDAQGNEWRSSAAPQPDDAFIEISSLDFYGAAPNAEQAYKTNMAVKLWLTNPATGESKLFEADELVIPFSHPQ